MRKPASTPNAIVNRAKRILKEEEKHLRDAQKHFIKRINIAVQMERSSYSEHMDFELKIIDKHIYAIRKLREVLGLPGGSYSEDVLPQNYLEALDIFREHKEKKRA